MKKKKEKNNIESLLRALEIIEDFVEEEKDRLNEGKDISYESIKKLHEGRDLIKDFLRNYE